MRPRIYAKFCVLACVVLACVLPSRAQQQSRPHLRTPQRPPSPQLEQILSFHSDITLQNDSTLQVKETIDVIAANHLILHGIYRDFPTHYADRLGNNYVVGFQVLGASLDSQSVPFRVDDISNGKRIYLGDPRALVSKGHHVYTIAYTTTRQLGFFKDHDELFWNVTGNGWIFPIQHADATVHLPPLIPATQVKLAGYTGRQGSYESSLTSAPQDSGFQFAATRPLRSQEGLTILLTWPKGFFAEPTPSQKLQFFFQDNRDALLLLAGFLVVLVYYIVAWSAVGRDPAPGVIMANYQPPQNLSPAAMRYLVRMGFDNKTFAAAILDMGARGFLTIKELAGSYRLYTTGKPASVLSEDEQMVAASLFNGRTELWLHQENHTAIRDALSGLKDYLASKEQKTYFVTNARYLIAPIAFSVIVALIYLLLSGPPKVLMCAFLALWLSVWSLAVYGLWTNAASKWRATRGPSSVGGEVGNVGSAIGATFIAIPFTFFELMALWFLWKMTSFSFVIFVLSAGLLHVVFLHLMKAPTFAGRRLMDQVEGFKMFLGAVDGDRLNRAAPPEQTPAVFEKFLPYALALDVEQHWAEKFSRVLATAGTTPDHSIGVYTPSFYSGSSWNGFGATGFASSFGSSFTSAIASSATAPGSGGGGGSGGSGGGGGGGGGGGW
jgi:uncharacterized membrane protein YgcG